PGGDRPAPVAAGYRPDAPDPRLSALAPGRPPQQLVWRAEVHRTRSAGQTGRRCGGHGTQPHQRPAGGHHGGDGPDASAPRTAAALVHLAAAHRLRALTTGKVPRAMKLLLLYCRRWWMIYLPILLTLCMLLAIVTWVWK